MSLRSQNRFSRSPTSSSLFHLPAIRNPDGTYIGSICLASNPLDQIRDPNLRARKVAENRERPVAGKGIGRSWAFGFYLSPDVVGRGLMTVRVCFYWRAFEGRSLTDRPTGMCVPYPSLTGHRRSVPQVRRPGSRTPLESDQLLGPDDQPCLSVRALSCPTLSGSIDDN